MGHVYNINHNFKDVLIPFKGPFLNKSGHKGIWLPNTSEGQNIKWMKISYVNCDITNSVFRCSNLKSQTPVGHRWS